MVFLHINFCLYFRVFFFLTVFDLLIFQGCAFLVLSNYIRPIWQEHQWSFLLVTAPVLCPEFLSPGALLSTLHHPQYQNDQSSNSCHVGCFICLGSVSCTDVHSTVGEICRKHSGKWQQQWQKARQTSENCPPGCGCAVCTWRLQRDNQDRV